MPHADATGVGEDASSPATESRAPGGPSPRSKRQAAYSRPSGLLVLGLIVCTASWAQSVVYRCADGLYADKPCEGGQALATAHAPDGRRVQEARLVASRERGLAEQLTAERRAREQARVALAPAAIRPPSPAWMQPSVTRAAPSPRTRSSAPAPHRARSTPSRPADTPPGGRATGAPAEQQPKKGF